jgi:ketosteroid isomerase-like protein
MKNKTVPFLLLLALAACTPAGTEDGGAVSGGYGAGEDARQSLMATDQAWSDALNDADAFAARMAPDVYFLPPDEPRVQGPAALRSVLEPILQLPGAQLAWSPDVAEVSDGGDMGYTIGSFDLTVDDADGEPLTRTGKYVTIWKRQDDGSWKVVADTFNFDAPMPGASEAG